MAHEINLINLTSHVVKLINNDTKESVSLPPTGSIARVSIKRKKIDVFIFNDAHIPIYESKWGNVKGLPNPSPNTYYIVSSIVADACGERKDLLVPDNPCYHPLTGGIIGMFGLRINKRDE